MKNILNKQLIPFLLVFSMMVIITLFTSCNNNDDDITNANAPVITEVRNYAKSPNDTLVTSINPGQWIVIHGSNLKNAKQISFNGRPADFNAGLFSENTAVLQVPSSIPFNNVDSAILNTINYVTREGATTFKFNVSAPLATITGNSFTAANVAGDEIFIYGTNLYLIEKLTIAGIDVPSFTTVEDGSSIGFALPEIDAPMPWEGMVVAESGAYEFSIIIVSDPLINAVSNANPLEGDLIRVYGENLTSISSISFGEAVITDYTQDPDGFFVEFMAPDWSSYASGPVTIVSTHGTATTPYNVNTRNGVTDGLLADFEGWGGTYFGYAWWQHLNIGGNADFDGSMGTNEGLIGFFQTPILAGGDRKEAFFNSNSDNYWIPEANLSDPVENWGLQFEMSVAEPWNGGTLYIQTAIAGENFVARYEPWKISDSQTADFMTDGWQTVTIPLSQFKSKVTELGDGDSITNLAQLIGPTGASNYVIYFKNFSSDDTKTGFYAGFDNIRVVKIK